MDPITGILVGVDGSPAAAKALDWALSEAAIRELPLTVLTTWHRPYLVDPYGVAMLADVGDAGRSAAQHVAETALAGALARRSSALPVTAHAITAEGPAAPTLLKLSETADHLVLGSRGNGGFERLLLGSVSSACVHHARCPVTVIPDDRPKAD